MTLTWNGYGSKHDWLLRSGQWIISKAALASWKLYRGDKCIGIYPTERAAMQAAESRYA